MFRLTNSSPLPSTSYNSVRRSEWVKALLEKYRYEATSPPITHLPVNARDCIWDICHTLGYNKHGVPGYACQLLERYLTKVLFGDVPAGSETLGFIPDIASNMARIRSNILLIVMCCIQLATKMSSRTNHVKVEDLHRLLLAKGRNCTTRNIKDMESSIAYALNFDMPLQTNVDISQTLAVEIGLSTDIDEVVSQIMNFAEFQRPLIDARLRSIANMTVTDAIGNLHLVAGAVTAAAYYTGMYAFDPAVTLANLSFGSVLYLRCIAKTIINEICVRNIDIKTHFNSDHSV